MARKKTKPTAPAIDEAVARLKAQAAANSSRRFGREADIRQSTAEILRDHRKGKLTYYTSNAGGYGGYGAKVNREDVSTPIMAEIRQKTAGVLARSKSKPAPSRPSLIEQAAAARAKKGISPSDRQAMADAARYVRKGSISAGTRVFFGNPGESRLQAIVAKGRRAVVMERVKNEAAKGKPVDRVVTPGRIDAPKPTKATGRGTPERLKKAQALRVERNRKKRGAKLHPGWGGGNAGHWVTIEEKGGGYHHVFIRD